RPRRPALRIVAMTSSEERESALSTALSPSEERYSVYEAYGVAGTMRWASSGFMRRAWITRPSSSTAGCTTLDRASERERGDAYREEPEATPLRDRQAVKSGTIVLRPEEIEGEAHHRIADGCGSFGAVTMNDGRGRGRPPIPV